VVRRRLTEFERIFTASGELAFGDEMTGCVLASSCPVHGDGKGAFEDEWSNLPVLSDHERRNKCKHNILPNALWASALRISCRG
jgi:hypothetical protein